MHSVFDYEMSFNDYEKSLFFKFVQEEIKEADTNRVAAPASVMYAALLPAVLRRLRHPRCGINLGIVAKNGKLVSTINLN